MARVCPRLVARPLNRAVEGASDLVEEAQPEVDAAAATVDVAAVVFAVVGRGIVSMLEDGSWNYVEDRQRESEVVEDRLGMALEGDLGMNCAH